MSIDRHQMWGLDSTVMKALNNIFNNWLPSATMTFTNKTLTSPTITSPTISSPTITSPTITTPTTLTLQSAEHGAGAIGTGVAPTTYRGTVDGHIITEIKVDLTGLASIDTANDVIGLVTDAPDAYLGQYTISDFGVIYKAQMICLETPAGGDNDINLIFNSTGTLGYNDAGGTTGLNCGDWVAGKSVESEAPGGSDDDYIYLTAGTGDTDGTYTAGQFIIRLYGHAVLS